MNRFSSILLISAMLLLSGCASTYGALGIASRDYVDQRLTETDQKIISTEQQLAETAQVSSRNYSDTLTKLTSLEDEVVLYEERAREIDQLIEEIAGIKAATSSLQSLADKVEYRLDTIPRETLAELSRILQDYLNAPGEILSPDGEIEHVESTEVSQ